MVRTRREVRDKPAFGRIEFGSVIPCEKCRGTGTAISVDGRKSACTRCDARGFYEWRPDAMARDPGPTP